jgi:RimJ/RimL family protein N-acetyltransferase
VAGAGVTRRPDAHHPLLTPRLVLREFAPADVDDLLACDGDARVMRFLGAGLGPRTRDEVAAGIARMIDGYAARPGFGLLHASRRDDGRFVGACGLFPVPEGSEIEVAYRLPFDCWGHGYATEMAAAVVAHGFRTLGLPRIVGLTWPENAASQRVLRKVGMHERGVETHYGREMRVFVAERPPA